MEMEVVKCVLGASVGVGGAIAALPLLGFGSAGVAAGSVAAGVQGMIGNVAAGSLFAALQSTGAVGVPLAVKAVAGAVGCGGVLAALNN